MELRGGCEELGRMDHDCVETSSELVSCLSEIFSKGLKYAQTCMAALDARYRNPHIDNEKAKLHTLRIEPSLRKRYWRHRHYC